MDYIVQLACEPKTEIGSGDPISGTKTILEMLEAQANAKVIEHMAIARGKSLEELVFSAKAPGRQGAKERVIGFADLLKDAEPLTAAQHHCERCPANFLKIPFGCMGFIAHPVPQAAQKWILDRLQKGDERRPWSLFSKKYASPYHLLEALLCPGQPLDPWHCVLALLWLGALTIRISTDGMDLVSALRDLKDPDARRSAAALDLGNVQGAELRANLEDVHDLLRGLYCAWTLGVPLITSG